MEINLDYYKKFNETDALGQKIVIGQRYGYSQSSNGYTYVKVGIATKQHTNGKTTLRVEQSKKSLYEHPLLDNPISSKTITCKSAGLFPVEFTSADL